MNNRIVPYLTKYIRRQSGFTLLELMIALALALVIISGVAVVVSQAVKNNRLLSTQVEIQNNIHIIHNRLGLIFKNAMSSPCGHLEAMLASENNPTTSHLKRAYKLRAGREVAQHVGKVVMPQSPLLPSTDATTIRQQDFPLFLIGIAGHPGEPKDAAGQPLSNSLPSIVKGSEYFIAMDLPDKLLLDSNHAGLSSVRDVHGGTDAGAAIKTTQIAKRLRGKKSVPWIITDCQQGTVFLSSADEGIDTSHNIIPVDNDLLFAHGYRDGETLLSSIEVYAYYLSRSKNEAQNNLSRFNLLWKKKAQAQRLMGGVKAMTFEWGLGKPDRGMLQAYFDTPTLMNHTADTMDHIDQAFIRQHLINVRVTLTVEGYHDDNHYKIGSDKSGKAINLSKTVQHTYTIRSHMSRL